MDPLVVVAIIGLPSSLLVGVAAVIQARGAKRNTKTGNGMTAGQYLPLIHADLTQLRADVSAHGLLLTEHLRDAEAHAVAAPKRRLRAIQTDR